MGDMMASGKRAFSAVLAIVLSMALVSSFGVGTALADSSYTAGKADGMSLNVQAAKKGWVKTKSGKVYYRNGEKVTGLQKIGKNRYYFNSSGIMKTADVKVGKVKYFIKDNGVLLGAKSGSKYYYNTLKPMSKADAYDFATFNMARKIVKKVSGKKDSKATKLRKAFNWVMNKNYGIHRTFSPFQTNWTAIYARDHFNNKDGDCHADAAAFAYLAAAIGYKADVCLDAVAVGTGSSHAWCMIGKKVYDPLFAQSKSYSAYYGATSGIYEVNPTKRYRVPTYNPKNAPKNSKESSALVSAGKVGLTKVGKYYYYYKSGKAVKSTWKTISGKRYYFTSNGRAATLSTSVKGAYYVFDDKGVLQNSSTAGTRTVVVGGKTYQVNKDGKAVSGWSTDSTKRFDKTGLLMTGVHYGSDGFYAADSAGTYLADTTQALNAAAVVNGPVASLVALLGTPSAGPAVSTNCDGGYDVIRTYPNFMVISWQSDDPSQAGFVSSGDNAEQLRSIEVL